MKAVLYIVLMVVSGGAAVFSVMSSQKFDAATESRLELVAANKKLTEEAAATDKKMKEEKPKLIALGEKRELLTQSVDAVKSASKSLASDLDKLKTEEEVQNEEFSQHEKSIAEINSILAGLVEEVSFDTLPQKIQQLQEDKKTKQAKFEELEVLIGGADKSLATNQVEMDRLTKRVTDRNNRIKRNSVEAVVTAVNQDWGFLLIGAGSNSGFTTQTNLLVQRDGRMIGRVRPSAIEPAQTVAEIDLKALATGVRLLPGDHVILAKPEAN